MPRIENHKFSIFEAFQECFYIVPDYQREYVWKEKEVLQLLQDVDEQIGSQSEYFIGTILVAPTNAKNHYDVIDGKQRLTTFFLLLCVLRSRFKGESQITALNSLISVSYASLDGDTKTSLKLEPRYENASEVMQNIADFDGEAENIRNWILASGITSFGSLENLVNAYLSSPTRN